MRQTSVTSDRSPFFGKGIICDWCQTLGATEVERVWLQRFNKSVWNFSSFQIIAGILSGPKALDPFNCLVADFSSEMVKREVSMPSVSDTGTLGSALLSDFCHSFQKFLKIW